MTKDRNAGFDNCPSISLMFSFIDSEIEIPSLPSFPYHPLSLRSRVPLKPARGVLVSAVSYPSGVRGNAPAENELGAL